MAYKGKGQQVNRTTLADIFGVAVNTIDAWVRAGCPVVQRGQRGTEWVFNTADVRTWREDQAVAQASGTELADIDELRRRKLAAEATMAELELAKAKGLVAPLSEMDRMLAKVFAEVRTNLRSIPSRTVTSLIGETNERKFKSVLLDEIDQVLVALADMDLTKLDDDAAADGPEAFAEIPQEET